MKLWLKDKKNFIIFCCLIWFFCAGVSFIVVSILNSKVKNKILKSGISIVKNYSDRASLPLLEQDIKQLSILLDEIALSPDVVNSAIVDHRNNIIAYANAEMASHVYKKGTHVKGSVSYWEEGLSNVKQVINFSSNVMYADTKIGEIHLSFNTDKILKNKKWFSSLFVYSSVIMLVLIISFYRKELFYIIEGLKTDCLNAASLRADLSDPADITCPMCGSGLQFSRDAFGEISTNRFLLECSMRSEQENTLSGTSESANLSKIDKRKDLKLLKRKVTVRCLDILKRLYL